MIWRELAKGDVLDTRTKIAERLGLARTLVSEIMLERGWRLPMETELGANAQGSRHSARLSAHRADTGEVPDVLDQMGDFAA